MNTDIDAATAQRSQPTGVAPLGIVGMGHIAPIAGIAAHPATFEFPSTCRWLEGPDVLSQALRAAPSLYPAVLEAAQAVVRDGACAVLTTCGYFTPYQQGLAAALPVPVATSSLLQLPTQLATIGADRKVLVVAAVGDALDVRCLEASGVTATTRIRVIGLDHPGPFRDQVLHAAGITDIPAIIDQTVRAVRDAVAEDSSIAAICLECGDLVLAAQAVRNATGLPVADYLTLARWLYASTTAA